TPGFGYTKPLIREFGASLIRNYSVFSFLRTLVHHYVAIRKANGFISVGYAHIGKHPGYTTVVRQNFDNYRLLNKHVLRPSRSGTNIGQSSSTPGPVLSGVEGGQI